jgi:DNA-binding transcriptional LysR family regulator
MTLTQLRAFLAIVEAGSVHAAADQLFVTQSAVSASVSALQHSLGIQLVRRGGRGLCLTDAGVIYADYVRRVLGLRGVPDTSQAGCRYRPRTARGAPVGDPHAQRLLTSQGRRHPMPDQK